MTSNFVPGRGAAISRPDLATFQMVEAGIALLGVYGREEAAKFLLDLGVNFAVIVRVLSESGPRRAP